MLQTPPLHFKNPRRNTDEDDVIPRSKRYGWFGIRFQNWFVDGADGYGGAVELICGFRLIWWLWMWWFFFFFFFSFSPLLLFAVMVDLVGGW